MYREYKEATADGTNNQVSDEVKVSLMRDTFSVMMGDQFVNTESGKAASTFPSCAVNIVTMSSLVKFPLLCNSSYFCCLP